MLKQALHRCFGSSRRLLARVAHDCEGVAAIEFGYLAPVMLIMLIGTLEVSRAINMDRRFGVVTAMTGDLIAREKTMNDTQLEAIMESIAHVMRPYESSSLKVSVISVKASSTDANDTRVEWSYGHNGGTPPAQCASYTLPSGMVSPGASVIVVETSYDFTPLITGFVYKGLSFSPKSWTDKSIHSPRNSCVDYNGTNCVLTCT
ncbi:MAG: TadE/TadG family type IV pilus assembly protein [Pseudomonadota bacterium]